jgi:hypothetical protein
MATVGLPARMVAAGRALLGAAVLADSAIEHYRGSFHNPFMAAPVTAAAAMLARRDGRHSAAAILTGAVGLGFHFRNILKRPGRLSFTNLFHGAPIGAPAALILAGASGLIRSPRALGALAAVGLAGTAGEAGLLHFRGAYHNPAMWAPVTLPPAAGLALARDAIGDTARAGTALLLGATLLLGLAGSGFHIWGIHRQSGGWANWRQNVLAGPPVPAPPAFTGLALIGLAALLRMGRRDG